MKKISIVILLMLLITGCNNNSKSEKLLDFSQEKSSKNFAEIYSFEDGRKIYSEFANIEFIINENESVNLKDALNQNKISIDDIINKMTYQDSLNDGGSVVYYYSIKDNNLANKDFYLVKCHNIIENKNNNNIFNENIIIGSELNIVEKCND